MNKVTNYIEQEVPELGQKQSPVRWAIMMALPFVVFFVSMFLGRYDVTPGEVLKIFANTVFRANFEQTWTDSAQKVISAFAPVIPTMPKPLPTRWTCGSGSSSLTVPP